MLRAIRQVSQEYDPILGVGLGDLNDYAVLSSLDLFRYGTDAVAFDSGVLDNAFGGNPYFSIDGGTTNLGNFSTGQFNVDKLQASHWLDNSGLGILDFTASNGELLSINDLDSRAFEALGWDLTLSAAPEPSSVVLFAIGFTFFSLRRTLKERILHSHLA